MTTELVHQFIIDMPDSWHDNNVMDSRYGSLTYGELNSVVPRLAAWLKEKGVSRQDRVAICLPKRIVSVEFILAALYVGATYVPVDYTAPVDRIKKIVTDAAASLIITLSDIETALIDAGVDASTISSVENPNAADAVEPFISDIDPIPPELVSSDDLAAFLYTSGSTGNPKGVMLSHQNIAVFSRWVVDSYQLTMEDRLASHAPFYFDLSTMDLFSTFISGASVYIFDEIEKRFLSTMSKVIQDKKITSWYSVPSALMLLEEKGALDRRDLSSLRQIFFAGEVYPLPALRKIMTRFPDVKFINLYGPTETNVCTYYEMPGVPDADVKSIPIGRACEHYQLTVLDDEDQPLGVGEKGEIVIAGTGVMKGYWEAEDKTAASRVGNAEDSYRTGDYGVLQEDGNVIYMGRKDGQVKIQGYRVELNEIENVANTHVLVRESAAVVLEFDDIKRIYLCVAPQKEDDVVVIERDLLSWCSKDLPGYAVPEDVLVLSEFGRTSTGKIDRQAIRRIVEEKIAEEMTVD